MARSNSKSSVRRVAPARNQSDLFGPAPLIEGEDPAAYRELLGRISALVRPADIIEELYVRDMVDLQWLVMRYRRLNAEILGVKKEAAFSYTLTDLRDEAQRYFSEDSKEEFQGRLIAWLYQDGTTDKEVNDKFAQAGLTRHAVMAAALLENIDVIGRIEELCAMAEARRNAALREFERHRTTFGRAVRAAIAEIEDAAGEKSAA